MRITQTSIAASTLANLQSSLQRSSRLQEQLSSGKVINRASDSPSGTVSSLALRTQIGANEQYSRNANDAKAWLGTADSTLQSVNSRLQRVRELTLSASSTGNMDVNSRQALAAEVTSLRSELMGLANTTYAGRPIFGGTTSGSQAFDPTTYTYVGDGGSVVRRLDARSTVDAAASGTAVFGDGATSVFTLLDDIAAHAVGDTSQLAGDLTKLDSRSQQVLQTLTDVGVRYNRAEAAATTADNTVLSLRTTLSGVEDIDLPKTIMDLQLQQTTYQAALSATAKVLQPSLMDFLR
ncbi:flagellar hook-associated protein FlgL [Angustibacter sp. Root456]|uniref:flagellar hook-associated protein FlgL n=1 Tax=Angustibacter sp. Root456 TaxID=1736539 RepID=UPI000AE094EA|nr:flagellar hook-associated protein FlgL [Angustibacter sp. Root456]